MKENIVGTMKQLRIYILNDARIHCEARIGGQLKKLDTKCYTFL